MRIIKFRFWDETYKKFYYMGLYNDRSYDTFPYKNSPQGNWKSLETYMKTLIYLNKTLCLK